MPSFDVAHIREQGQDMLLFPLGSSYHHKTDFEQSEILAELENRAHAAGLRGRAAAFWEHSGRGYFRGPSNWSAFLRNTSLSWVQRQVNREISWN